jgi:hypothetical protein
LALALELELESALELELESALVPASLPGWV